MKKEKWYRARAIALILCISLVIGFFIPFASADEGAAGGEQNMKFNFNQLYLSTDIVTDQEVQQIEALLASRSYTLKETTWSKIESTFKDKYLTGVESSDLYWVVNESVCFYRAMEVFGSYFAKHQSEEAALSNAERYFLVPVYVKDTFIGELIIWQKEGKLRVNPDNACVFKESSLQQWQARSEQMQTILKESGLENASVHRFMDGTGYREMYLIADKGQLYAYHFYWDINGVYQTKLYDSIAEYAEDMKVIAEQNIDKFGGGQSNDNTTDSPKQKTSSLPLITLIAISVLAVSVMPGTFFIRKKLKSNR